jgi:hypothetical protein
VFPDGEAIIERKMEKMGRKEEKKEKGEEI